MPAILDVWPREAERQPFDAAAWNAFANYANGDLSAPLTLIDENGNQIVGVDNATPALAFDAPATFGASLTANAAVTLGNAAGDAVSILGTLTVTPQATFTGGLLSNGPTTLGDAAADAISILGTATFTPLATFSAGIAIAAGNLAFAPTGSAQRITGDFSNATFANRPLFQTSTANGFTGVDAIPNGTGAGAAFEVFSASNPAASARLILYAGTTDHYLLSDHAGATYLPLSIMAGGLVGLKLQANGDLIVGSGTGKKIGVFGAAGAVRATGGASTAGAAYTATEQGMIQTMWDALRGYGWLS